MGPRQRGQVSGQFFWKSQFECAQLLHGAFEIDGIPQHNPRHHEIEATGPIALILVTAFTDFPETISRLCGDSPVE